MVLLKVFNMYLNPQRSSRTLVEPSVSDSLDTGRATFITLHPDFREITGPNPKRSICCEVASAPFFHEAGVFISKTDELFVTSNRYEDNTGEKVISISKVTQKDGHYSRESIHPDICMANGGVNYRDGVLFCDQGNLSHPGGLVYMSIQPPYQSETILSDFQGTPFNSVNDVVVSKDGAIWFTDPIYGYEQGFRPKPQLPSQVYRYDPSSGSLRAVADGFGRPNGIAFSPDQSVVYITDTDHIHGDGSMDPTRASSIYAFDIIHSTKHSTEPFLTNRRLFAFASGRVPDGIKCDTNGNVYSGCLDGISVWSPGGVLLGKILIPGGVANFCFCRAGEIMALNERRLWRVDLAASAIGALLAAGMNDRDASLAARVR